MTSRTRLNPSLFLRPNESLVIKSALSLPVEAAVSGSCKGIEVQPRVRKLIQPFAHWLSDLQQNT